MLQKTFTPVFNAMLERDNFVILDTETSGITRPAEIIEVAIINRNGEIILNQRVKPVHPIPDAASFVHGITDNLVADCPPWPEVRSLVLSAIAGRDVIVYNATYDRKLMHWSDEECGAEQFNYRQHADWYCAMEEFARYHGEVHPHYGSFVWKSLAYALDFMGIEHAHLLHSALGDCLATLQLIQKCTAELAVWIPF